MHNTNEMDSNDSLIKRYREGDKQALNELIENNQGLVHHALKSFKWAYNSHPKYDEIISYDDFFQEGVMGLYSCVDGYDPEKGAFSTYASWWIRQAIYRFYYDNSRVIRVPAGPRKAYKELKQFENKYIEKYGHEPSTKELSYYSRIPFDDILEIRRIFTDAISFDAPISGTEGESISIGDSIPDNTDFLEGIDRELTIKALRKDLERMAEISIKDKRKIKILFTYFDKLENKLIKDIAIDLNISRSNMSRIIGESINQMNRRFLDELTEKYCDLISSDIRRVSMGRLKEEGNRLMAQITVSRIVKIGDSITVNEVFSDCRNPKQCTVKEIDRDGMLLRLISKDKEENLYQDNKQFLYFSDIIDFKTENKRLVEVGCIKGIG